MDALEELSKQYDQSEFRLVGICADLYDKNGELRPEQLETAQKIVGDAGVTFTNLIPDAGCMDFIHTSVVGFPTTFFVNSEGKIVSTVTGANDAEGWKSLVDAELQKMDQ